MLALVFILIGFRLGPLTRQALERSRPLTAIDQLVATRLVSPREAAVSPQGPAAVALDWARIHSTNYPTYLRNLREVGCPPRTIRNILLADINASFDIRKALRPSDPGYLAPEALERERQQITTALLSEIGWKEESVSAGGLLSALDERLQVLHQSIPFNSARPREWQLAIEAAEREFFEAAAREVPKEELAEFATFSRTRRSSAQSSPPRAPADRWHCRPSPMRVVRTTSPSSPGSIPWALG